MKGAPIADEEREALPGSHSRDGKLGREGRRHPGIPVDGSRPPHAHDSTTAQLRFRRLAGGRAYGLVQSGWLQPFRCVWPTRLPLASVHHQETTLGRDWPGSMILIWTLPPAATVPELRLTPPLPSCCPFANVPGGFCQRKKPKLL